MLRGRSRGFFGLVGVLKGFVRDAEASSEGIGSSSDASEKIEPCLVALGLVGENGLEVDAGGWVLTGRGLDLEVERSADDDAVDRAGLSRVGESLRPD